MNTITQVHAKIASAFAALDFLNDITTTHYLDKLYAMIARMERAHRRSRSPPCRCTVEQASHMFCVRILACYASGRSPIPSAAEMLSLRDDYVYAAQIAANYRERILAALAGHDIEWLVDLDYVKLVNGVPQ